VALIGLTTKT